MQDAFAMQVHEADTDLLNQIDGFTGGQRLAAGQLVFQRSIFDEIHHVIGRLGIPTDIQQLHHVAIGGEKDEFFDLA